MQRSLLNGNGGILRAGRALATLGLVCGLALLACTPADARKAKKRHSSKPVATLSAKSIAAGLGAAAATTAALAAGSRGYGGSQLAALAANPAAAVAVAVAATHDRDSTRLVFELSAPIAASAFVLADPDRVIVDLPEVNFQIDPAQGRAAKGLIASYRFGRFAAGKSRVIIDLASPATVRRLAMEQAGAGEPARLVIELAPLDRPAFLAAASEAARLETEAAEARRQKAAPVAVVSTKPVIVLDPGHGGIDSGALGVAGAVEKAIVFDFARALAKKLEATNRYKVILTRDSDVFVSLGDRMRLAREHRAALFISLHADSLSDHGDVTGATVYTVSERASDAEAARVADKENSADLAGGVAGPAKDGDVADILFDLTRRETRAYGHVFARGLINEWKAAGRLNKNPQRSAGFHVLKAFDVPSVLLELGYLSSEKDSKAMQSGVWQDRAALSVAKAVETFLAPRTASDEQPGIDPIATGSIGPRGTGEPSAPAVAD